MKRGDQALTGREAALAQRRAWVAFGLSVGVLAILFGHTLWRLGRLALSSDLYSHTLLIPLVTVYLASTQKGAFREIRGDRGWAALAAGLGLVPLLWFWTGRLQGRQLELEDSLFLEISALVVLVIASGLLFLGRKAMSAVALPVALLFFLAPFPKAAELSIERFFQYTSAEAAALLFRCSDIALLRQGLVFELPGIILEVGRECSGIRSSLVLFITSIIAGYLFLQTPWKRALLTLVVIPLAILRNGFRIFVIGWLCVRVDPAMIHSWVHQKGGPLFFVLSLVPFFALLLLLRKSEAAGEPVQVENTAVRATADQA